MGVEIDETNLWGYLSSKNLTGVRGVLDEAIAGSGELGLLHHEIESLQHSLSNPDNADSMDQVLERYGEAQHRYESLGGYGLEAQARFGAGGQLVQDVEVLFDLRQGQRRNEQGRQNHHGDKRGTARYAPGQAGPETAVFVGRRVRALVEWPEEAPSENRQQ